VLFNKLHVFFKGDLKGKKIAMWGLSFKPNTDDMREAPALVLVEKLLAAGCSVVAYDPVAMHEAQRKIGNIITYADTLYNALDGADALMLVTEWTEFRYPDWNDVKKRLKTPLVLDGRNIYDRKEMKENGFYYYCIGNKTE